MFPELFSSMERKLSGGLQTSHILGAVASHPCTWRLRRISMSRVCSKYDFSLLAQQRHWTLPAGMEGCSSHEATKCLVITHGHGSEGHVPGAHPYVHPKKVILGKVSQKINTGTKTWQNCSLQVQANHQHKWHEGPE